MNDRVYLVCLGEYAEGHTPVAAYSHFLGALGDAQIRRHANLNPFVEVEPGRWKSALNGCDECWIIRLPVDDKPDVAPKPKPKRPQGTCPWCGRTKSLTLAGDLYGHDKPRDSGGSWAGRCPGGRRRPLEATE